MNVQSKVLAWEVSVKGTLKCLVIDAFITETKLNIYFFNPTYLDCLWTCSIISGTRIAITNTFPTACIFSLLLLQSMLIFKTVKITESSDKCLFSVDFQFIPKYQEHVALPWTILFNWIFLHSPFQSGLKLSVLLLKKCCWKYLMIFKELGQKALSSVLNCICSV